jgi:hypothetical protein
VAKNKNESDKIMYNNFIIIKEMKKFYCSAFKQGMMLVLAIMLFVQCGSKQSGKTSEQKSSDSLTRKQEAVKPPEKEAVPTPKFTYTSPAPVNGVLKGVVELGSTGFNSFIVNIDDQKRWELKKADFGASLVYENLTTKKDVVAKLKEYISDMIKYGVAGKYIYFVVSSSAVKVSTVQDIIGELRAMKYVVHTVTAEEEAEWGFYAAMPQDYRNTGFMVDIGSGNTKIAWLENDKLQTRETYGAKYRQNGVEHDKVTSDITELSQAVPADKRGFCFIIGGVPFKMAKTHRIDKESYTVLNAPETYSFDSEREQSGVNIYSAIRKGSGCNLFVFNWDANFVIGYLLK